MVNSGMTLNKLTAYASHVVKLELMKARLEVFTNDSGGVGVDFIVKAKSGHHHEISLQTLNLEKDRSVKISKKSLNHDLRDNLWIALVLFMKEMEPSVYLIPSKVLETPDDYIFIDNDQGKLHSHLSNWEIKVFTKAIKELSQYAFGTMVKKLS